jgi:hypothetical protein
MRNSAPMASDVVQINSANTHQLKNGTLLASDIVQIKSTARCWPMALRR